MVGGPRDLLGAVVDQVVLGGGPRQDGRRQRRLPPSSRPPQTATGGLCPGRRAAEKAQAHDPLRLPEPPRLDAHGPSSSGGCEPMTAVTHVK